MNNKESESQKKLLADGNYRKNMIYKKSQFLWIFFLLFVFVAPLLAEAPIPPPPTPMPSPRSPQETILQKTALQKNLSENDASLSAIDSEATIVPEASMIEAKVSKFAEKIFPAQDGGYTINFSSVSITEYIRFVSKICNVNFLFNESELQFNVTVMSEDPITPQNVMATLIQILRIHGLTLLEEENNLVIHKNDDVKQIAKFTAGKDPLKNPLVTRVFRIRNANVDSVAAILKSMISKDSILEVSAPTRQIILTDVTTNVDKIAQLIDTIDSSESPLEISSYKAQKNSPDYLIGITKQIITPLSEGAPFLLVPQILSNTIYIVSTPKLIEKAISVLSNLDTQPNQDENIFVYKVINRPISSLDGSLKNIAQSLLNAGFPKTGIVETLNKASWVPDSDCFLFTGSQEAIAKLKEILIAVDISPNKNSELLFGNQFLIYKPQFVAPDLLKFSLKEVANTLNKSNIADEKMIDVIDSVKWIESTQSFLFTGDPSSLARLELLLKSLDTAQTAQSQAAQAQKNLGPSTYLLYKLKYVAGDIIEEDLDNFAKKLKAQNLSNPELIKVLEGTKWIKETNSLLLTGSPVAIQEAKEVIANYDVPRKEGASAIHGDFFMYRPEFTSPELIQQSLRDIAKNLENADLADPHFLKSIATMKYVESTRSLVFTGTPASLEKIQTLIKTIDIPTKAGGLSAEKGTVFIYKIMQANPQQLMASLRTLSLDLKKSDSMDYGLIAAINSMKYDSSTNSLIFMGVPSALGKIKTLVEKFDIKLLGEGTTAPNTFFVYKPLYLSGPDLESILHDFIDHLKMTGFANKNLFISINSVKWVENTNSLIFTGDEASIEEIKSLLATFDVPGKDSTAPKDTIQPIHDVSFLVYKLQYHKGDEIQTALKQIAADMKQSNTPINETLFNAINSVQLIQITNSLLCSGDQETMTRLKELIRTLDIPLKQVFIEMLVLETDLTNLLQFGLDWGGKAKYKNFVTGSVSNLQPGQSSSSSGFPSGLNNFNPTTQSLSPGSMIPFTSGFDLGVIGDILFHKGKSFFTMGSLLQALQDDTEVSIVMTPKLITQDGKTSNIFIGQNIPFLGSQTTNSGPNTVTTQNLEYRDVGMNLTLTPVLGNSDTVTLTIELENTAKETDASGNTITSGTLTGITTTKTTMNTTVHIPNKNFLVLSGMVRDEKRRDKAGLPCLGGLPWIGAAFSQSNTQKSKTNLVIFIRPHIINSYKDMVDLTEAQESFFREHTGNALLEQEFEEGIESIKGLDNEEID